MKAITIIQPWATLLAIGAKQNETSRWATKHRGPVGIHAGKKIDKAACEVPEVKGQLARHGYTAENLPTGAVLAIGKVADCYGITEFQGEKLGLSANSQGTRITRFLEEEISFRDYRVDRYAWAILGVRQLDTPIPAKGKLSLWNFEMPQPNLKIVE